jgi:hypothetical protein
MKYTVEMCPEGTIYIQSFMKIGTGIQAILKFCLSNLNVRTVAITHGRDL